MKPPFSYIGNKATLLSQIDKFVLQTINKYIDPFAGGGSVFLHVNQTRDVKHNYINDLDTEVTNIWRCIQKEPHAYVDTLDDLDESLYSTYVDLFNEKARYMQLGDIHKAGLFTYLTKRCYKGNFQYRKNGSARLGSSWRRGKFYDVNNIYSISNVLENTTITERDVFEYFNDIEIGCNDFVFLDPPYLVSS